MLVITGIDPDSPKPGESLSRIADGDQWSDMTKGSSDELFAGVEQPDDGTDLSPRSAVPETLGATGWRHLPFGSIVVERSQKQNVRPGIVSQR